MVHATKLLNRASVILNLATCIYLITVFRNEVLWPIILTLTILFIAITVIRMARWGGIALAGKRAELVTERGDFPA